MASRPTVAVHKFSSCDGCQLAFLNLGEDLLTLSELVDIVHFVEAGAVQENALVDVAFVEGSITTPHDVERIQHVRDHCNYLVTMGACATAGGIQALRNLADAPAWKTGVYASPEYIETLETSTAIADHVKVDLELWGCPIGSHQIVAAVRSLLFGVSPVEDGDKVCMDCKRKGNVCVLVTRGEPCMGPVTRTGCGALCPSFGRECYACFGPSDNPNTASYATRLEGLGLPQDEVARRFLFINNAAPEFLEEGIKWKDS